MSEISTQTDKKRHAWQSEASEILAWIEAHPTLLTASAIVLPSISITHYINTYHVPISITSPDILATLPLILATIALITVSLGVLLLLPFSVLFETIERKSDGSLQLLPKPEDGRGKTLLIWFSLLILPGVIFGLGGIALEHWLAVNPTIASLIVVASALLVAGITYSQIPRNQTRRFSFSTFLIALGSSLCQMFMVLSVMLLVLKSTDAHSSMASVAGKLSIAILILAALQLFMLALVEATSRHAGILKQACMGSALFVVVLCFLPITGARLAGNIISRTAMGGVDCVRFGLTDDAWNDFGMLRDTSGTPASRSPAEATRHTANVRVLANVDGAYLVQKQEATDKAFYRIPADGITSLAKCPN